MQVSGSLKLGVDTGGTFTDFILQIGEELKRYKCASTPADPSVAILQGISYFFPDGPPPQLEIIHGTTVGTNAFLERKGGRPLLLTTKGFEDVIVIGRQNRDSLFDIGVSRSKPLVPRHLVVGVSERMDASGKPVVPLSVNDVLQVQEVVEQYDVDTVVICFLHSFLNDAHEKKAKELLAGLDIPVLCSVDILPEFREFERCSTALVNGYLAPVMTNYIEMLTARLEGRSLAIQQSNGGVMAGAAIRDRAAHTLLSGPAAGVQGAYHLAGIKGQKRFITFDMGGTSTDVFLCDGSLSHTKEYILDGYPISIPMLDIHTVGAGGGSIAFIDPAGVLQVGPMSAGADPGPICYGKGRKLTVTDANLLLGRLVPEAFLGGRMMLDVGRATRYAEEMALQLGVSVTELCLGVLAIVTAEMVKAVRTVSLDRGHDPADFRLYSFGGSSGLQCCDLADELGITTIEVPDRAGVLSAQGLVFAPALFDRTRTLFLEGAECTYQRIIRQAMELEAEVAGQLSDVVRAGRPVCESFADLRYSGQSYEVAVLVHAEMMQDFHARHEQLFGYSLPGHSLECVALRSVARLAQSAIDLPLKGGEGTPEPCRWVSVVLGEGALNIPVYLRKSLRSKGLSGPCLIIDDYTTILVTPAFSVEVDSWGGLTLKKEGKA